MVQKSKGPRRRTRNLLKIRAREKTPITRYLQEFEIGKKVVIYPNPASSNGRPFRRFFGRTGTIMERRGKSYIVKIKDGKKEKELITRPEHLKAI
jgi:large subunit ribosomal protein L21e